MTPQIHLLAHQLGEKLAAKQWTVSCAESCTGGGIGYAITAISGSSTWFKQGLITYSNEAKQQLLGVSEQTLNSYGAVSQQTVEAMVVGAVSQAQANIGVSVSGIAGPDGGSAEKPVGTVWFGFYVDGKIFCEKQLLRGDREQIRLQAIEFALTRLNRTLD